MYLAELNAIAELVRFLRFLICDPYAWRRFVDAFPKDLPRWHRKHRLSDGQKWRRSSHGSMGALVGRMIQIPWDPCMV